MKFVFFIKAIINNRKEIKESENLEKIFREQGCGDLNPCRNRK